MTKPEQPMALAVEDMALHHCLREYTRPLPCPHPRCPNGGEGRLYRVAIPPDPSYWSRLFQPDRPDMPDDEPKYNLFERCGYHDGHRKWWAWKYLGCGC